MPGRGNKILGEASTACAHTAVAAGEIHAFDRASRIAIVIRGPVAFLHARYSRHGNETQETASTLRAALDREGTRTSGRSLPPWVRRPNDLSYSERVRTPALKNVPKRLLSARSLLMKRERHRDLGCSGDPEPAEA